MEFTLVFEGLDFKAAGEALHREVRRGADRAVRVACETGESVAKREAPFREGTLRDSIKGRPTGGSANVSTGVIEATAKHAGYMAHGTDPHVIRAKRAKALRWEDGGGVRFAQSVNHPGTKPDDFFERGEQAADSDLQAAMTRATEEAIAKIGR